MLKKVMSLLIALVSVGVLFGSLCLPVSAASANTTSFSLPHALTFTTTGNWTRYTDTNGDAAVWAPSNGSTNTASARWNFAQNSCTISVWIPVLNANVLDIAYGFYNGSTRTKLVHVNQSAHFGWVNLGQSNNTTSLGLSNDDGQTGSKIGIRVAPAGIAFSC